MEQKVLFRAGGNCIFLPLVLFMDSRMGDARWVQDFIFLFPMLIKGMRRRYEFKVFLHDPRDGRILWKDSPKIFPELLRNRECAL